ncbi:FadR/GntR family transcriptional regulator [Sporomusa acidovorans]|uniref:HTH-type transcriptional regulator LutR n=1 Tax=Sporomusa acidovorans (strain ATCC 49682 / DSM 3132 / Mol) TaxID=1123286 RepID=A0ABZ3J757_SPOA4|nr:FadR/GntR family transcriptional regulator [Sporomusa acidovorans]OZC18485.1 HTH-type transcriptional regulator LutR [Sporomusa acidovorans DSM 3132]SDE36274.1 GntR family transcriptional regulator, transcriptional repressor for pyruvate dehydrogenase complex [Sporomusa acidovorans]
MSVLKRKVIQKLAKESVTDQIYEVLKDYITSKEWEPGHKLPSENELAEQFGVSRMSVRMVLQKLNTLGLTETRVGEGTFVKKFDFKSYLSEVSEFVIDQDMVFDLNEFRMYFELPMLQLAINKATDEEIIILEEKTKKFLRAENIDELARYDYEFHLEICKMGKNTLFIMFFEQAAGLIQNYLRTNIAASLNGIKTVKDIFDYHKEIVNAIKARKFEEAKCVYINMMNVLWDSQ